MPPDVFDRLTQLLTTQDAPFEVSRHEKVFTSEEAAAVRGASLTSGAKALICKVEAKGKVEARGEPRSAEFLHFVIPADLRLASKQIRQACGLKSLRFASAQEVWELTGLTPGAIPPFGSLFGLPTWCDEQLRLEPEINFNAGDHGISIRMPLSEFSRVEQPQWGSYAQLRDSGDSGG